jgi:hypothetical protein
LFAPSEPQVELEVVIISDDEEDPMIEEDVPEDEEESMATPTPTPAPTLVAAPAPTPAAAPVHVTASAVTPSSATSLMLVPSPAVQVLDEEMCWKRKYYFKPAPETAYYHTLLTKVLGDYYLDLHASIKYQCVEYQHPLEGTYWKADLAVCAWNDIKNAHEIETVHRHTARQANALDSMEDAA